MIVLVICFSLALVGCGPQGSATTTEPSEQDDVEVKEYPGDTGIELQAYANLVPEEVFTTTAEDNDLGGELYMILGTVEEYIQDDGIGTFAFRISTIDGDIVVSDPVAYCVSTPEASASLMEDGIEELRRFYPLPRIGEFIVILAEYQGMSESFGCPSFLYATEDYLLSAIQAVADMDAAGLESGCTETATEESLFTEAEPSAEASATPEEHEALSAAVDYLNFMPFSYGGLIEQLEYEGYSTAAATYAVDHCGADWNEQALKSAIHYLNYAAFSYTGVIEQLEYEGFTIDQATYSADNCGADWYEQAAMCAADYLNFMEFSRDDLISQLEHAGFTHDQAVYGAEANGL